MSDWRDNGPELEAERQKIKDAEREVSTWNIGVVTYYLYRMLSSADWETMKEHSEIDHRSLAADVLYLERNGGLGDATMFVCGPEDLGGE